MQTVNIHEAKTHLSKLIERAAQGESFIIAKAGKAMVKVVRVDAPTGARRRRLGFLVGHIQVPDDFDRMGYEEFEQLFGKE
ncbi:MAG: type II toxin-antitoxin system Phd/YefM family antitoxin [Acidiferrobacter sp.]